MAERRKPTFGERLIDRGGIVGAGMMLASVLLFFGGIFSGMLRVIVFSLFLFGGGLVKFGNAMLDD